VIDDKRDEGDADLDEEEEEDHEGEEEENDDEGDDEEFEDNEDEVECIEPERAMAYKKTLRQLRTFHHEISLISAKKPDSPINKFKLGLINETLEKANVVLGAVFQPFSGFKTFDDANMPSASDVVLMLSHYKEGLFAFKKKYCMAGHWSVTGNEPIDEDFDD
jgi:hypothetical protein